MSDVPVDSYGILSETQVDSWIESAQEDVERVGFTVIDSGLSPLELKHLSDEFDQIYHEYHQHHGYLELEKLQEHHTVRAPLLVSDLFLGLAANANLIALLDRLLSPKYILNQKNGIVNPSREKYNQSAWHRDMPYQHFVCDRPLSINALFCLDDFTIENGATFVLPGSHRIGNFPSRQYTQKNSIQIEAKRGEFIVLDCMVFHSGGYNGSPSNRRAVNHVYGAPFIKQQIQFGCLNERDLSLQTKILLGLEYREPRSVSEFLSKRGIKNA
jgi:hypothetical protein